MATAIEAIYRDLDYARSLVKGLTHQDDEAERATLRERLSPSPARRTPRSPRSSASSAHGGAISDWSVISDQDD